MNTPTTTDMLADKTANVDNPMDRVLVLEMVRVTEAAAVAAAQLVGRGDEKAADAAAVEAMRADQVDFVLTGPAIRGCNLWTEDREPCELETTCPGVFAAGDVRSGTTKRCAFAAGDGALAITCVHQYLNRG